MSIRRDPIYISSDVWRALRLMAKANADVARIVTVDEIADEILRRNISDAIWEHQKAVDKLEKDFLKSL